MNEDEKSRAASPDKGLGVDGEETWDQGNQRHE